MTSALHNPRGLLVEENAAPWRPKRPGWLDKVPMDHPGNCSAMPRSEDETPEGISIKHSDTYEIKSSVFLRFEGCEEALPEDFQDRIKSMQRRAGWSGRGSKAVSRAACDVAISFVEEVLATDPAVPLPKISPSVLGGIALQWGFGDRHFMVRVVSGDTRRIIFLEVGPGFHQDDGVASQKEMVGKLLKVRLGDKRS